MFDLPAARAQFKEVARRQYHLALADHQPRSPSSARVVRLLGDWWGSFSGGAEMPKEPIELPREQ